MPSGGSSGGGGHFSGGGRAVGGHFGSSGGSLNSRRAVRNGRPVFIYSFGSRSYYVGAKRNVLIQWLGILAIICIFACVALFGSFSDAGGGIAKIKTDFTKYNQMIEYAEEEGNENYLVSGVVTSFEYNEKYQKGFIRYYFLDENNNRVEGWSFYVYTYDELLEMKRTGSITLAVDSYPCTQSTDSIEVTYKTKSLNDDGEYVALLSSQKAYKKWTIASGTLAGAFVISVVVISILSFKKDVEEKEGTVAVDAQKIKPQQKTRYCSYCGSAMKEGETSCPYCGAGENKFESKDN